jgi:uncharacterized protein YndB with AHSA1/START domain
MEAAKAIATHEWRIHKGSALKPPVLRAADRTDRRSSERPDMTELRFETDIRASADRVFALMADLRDYAWLPKSSSFRGTTKISDGPIGFGTTYVEPSLLGTRRGTITAFEPPTRIDFNQPMTGNPAFTGVIGIRMFNTITPAADSVRLVRVVQLSPTGIVSAFMPLIVPAFKAENERVLKRLKAFAESAG